MFVAACPLLRRVLVPAILAILTACGGGGGGGGGSSPAPVTPSPGGGGTPPPPPVQTIPVLPVPTDLWQPAASNLPQSGNYVYLKSEMGATVPDFIGAGETYLYSDQKNDEMYVAIKDGRVNVMLFGAASRLLWSGDVAGINNEIKQGYYPGATRYPFQEAGKPGVAFGHHALSRACNQVTGWFVVDRLEYVNGKPSVIDLRFAQHCEGHIPALLGKIHWVFDLSEPPAPGPIAIPPGLWRADRAAVPASGNYVYLESDAGDFILDDMRAAKRLYTHADAKIVITGEPDIVRVGITGYERWDGVFQGRAGLGRLQAGYYGALNSVRPTADPLRGGLDWSGESRSGGAGNSWFVIDRAVYDGDTLIELDLRFAQHGGGMRAALRGEIHWRKADVTPPPGPVNPPPADLWRPPAGVVPASGNYTYLQSDQGDYIGAGQEYLYTGANAEFWMLQRAPGEIEFRVIDSDLWVGSFKGIEGMTQLAPGYYAGVPGFANPATGGLSWYGHARGCNESMGWYAIDSVTYSGTELTSIEIRFEQHCEMFVPAIRGAFRWTKPK